MYHLDFRAILFVASTIAIISIAVAMIFIFIFRVKVLGGFWLLFVVSLGGAILGVVLNEILHPVINFLANLNGGLMNIFPPLLISFFAVYLFSFLNKRNNKK